MGWAKSVRGGGDGDGEALLDTHPLSKTLATPTPPIGSRFGLAVVGLCGHMTACGER